MERDRPSPQPSPLAPSQSPSEPAVNCCQRGNSLCQDHRYAEALAAYDRAVALAPSYHQAWFNRGQLLTQMGAYGNALESYDQAIRHQPDPLYLPMYLHAREDIWIKKKLIKA